MTLAGTAITSVGDRPRHRLVRPSYRAIFTIPSQVPVNCLREDCSIGHASGSADSGEGEAEKDEFGEDAATQSSALLLIQNTSRQHAVTPSSGDSLASVDWNSNGPSGSLCGRSEVEDDVVDDGVSVGGETAPVCCACSRTRTTSSGVTGPCVC